MSNLDTDNDKELQQALAVLISNTRSTKRPLPLTSVARSLDTALRKLGTFSEVANRIGLSTKMLRQFSYVNRLTKNAQKLVENRTLDSVDAITHLAMLPPNIQEKVAASLEAGEMETGDIRTVAQLYRSGVDGSAQKLIRTAKDAKTKHEFIAEFVVRGSSDRRRILKTFKRFISPKEILRLEIKGAFGRLVLSGQGKKELVQAARKLGVSVNQVIPLILED